MGHWSHYLPGAALFLPENGKRRRHFFLAPRLCPVVCAGGRLVPAPRETWGTALFA